MQDKALLKELAGCLSAETLLATILKHIPDLSAPVPVEQVAQRLGITEIRELDSDTATSALLAAHGVILCKPTLSAQRRRFAIAHQLGHFLLSAQRGDRQCTTRDLGEIRRDTPHRKEEMQANRFAAGLLMPKPLFAAYVAGLGKPTVSHLPTIAAAYDVTLEAAASRYLELSPAMAALLFVKDGTVRYARASRTFPALSVQVGDPVPAAARAIAPDARIAWLPAEVRDWLTLARETRPPALTMQVLSKPSGFQLVFLFVNAAAERRADEDAEKDATERPKFGRPRVR